MTQFLHGKNSLFEYLKTGKKIYRVMLSETLLPKDKSHIERSLQHFSVPYEFMKKKELDKISDKNQGVILEIDEFEYEELDTFLTQNVDAKSLILFDHIEDPRNFGAIVRSAECAGVDAIIIPKDRGVKVNETVYKTSAGAVSFVPIIQVTNIARTCERLKEANYWLVGADGNADYNYTEVDYTYPTCFIVGSEGKGISKTVLKKCDFIVSIPMFGKVTSLNVSVATALLIYEAVRQREGKK
ncbi:MAG: 23S rRNA (guanosine(2251)-2'-O)-methyltransferase RlmB [Culicoidibacterales bacterium]